MNEMLGPAGQFSKGLAALFGLQEQEGVPTVAPELMPTSDIFLRPELWALHGGSLLWGRIAVGAGGVGNNSQIAIEPGPDELVIVEKVQMSVGSTAHILLMGLSQVPLTTSTGNLVARDARRITLPGGTAASGTRIRSQNTAPFATDLASVTYNETIVANTPAHVVEVDMVLVAPWSLRIVEATANTLLDVTVWVRARNATPRELSIGSL